MRKTNEAGLNLIKSFEGCKLQAYRDQKGILTIGYGHTGIDVTEGLEITPADAQDLLVNDLSTAEEAVCRLVTRDTNDNEFAALVSFTFNLGQGTLTKSTLLRCLNAGNRADAAAEFLKWNHVNGVISPGLELRRKAEKELFLSPIS